MDKKLLTIAIALMIFVITPGVVAYSVSDDGEPVHEYIAEQALVLYASSHPNSEIELWFPGAIKVGAGNEDLKDHVYDRSGAYTTMTHFWNADGGPNDVVDTNVLTNSENSWQKAEILWGMAVGEYRSGDKLAAYEYLGHVSHLLADQSVPAHVHEDMHYPDDDCYEDWMTLSNAKLSDDEKADLLSKGPVVIPDNSAWGPLYYLFYTTNQVADFFASDSDGYDGDRVDNYGGWMSGIYTELGMDPITKPLTPADLTDNDDGDNNDDGDLGVIRQYSYLYSIRSVAALYQLFDETVSNESCLTVVIDRVLELECHDDGMVSPYYDPDYYVEIQIGGFEYRNEGDQIENNPDIYPGWAFARDVGITGSIPIVIQLWDEDEDPNDDDPSDIDPVEDQRDLDFNVDLATGAISGDLTGTCGSTLESAGGDDDRSHIWFRVLLPNIPPTADAGPDQTVDEGDLVTLDGSFTDPNTEDTHTVLWHMEDSTNVQVVPDSVEDPMSFTPNDNGVYTFRYTVTDNHGAHGSDEVVITVNNVAPVVSAPYISMQPNTEFILPVVHAIDFEGEFSDAGTADTHTAVWDWGDSTTSTGTVDESGGSGIMADSHTYANPGDYMVTLTVTDDDSGTDSNTMTVHVADTDEALDIFNEYIQGLDKSMFKPKADQRKNAFDNMFSAMDDKLADQEYQGMIKSMNSDMRTKFDGLVDGNPKDDWIIKDLPVQRHLCQKVDDITQYLKHLQSTLP
jgi:hypothetical protein